MTQVGNPMPDIVTFPLFQNIAPEVIRKFLASGSSLTYDTGAQVIVNHDMGETFFLVLSGMAKLILVNTDNEAVNITLFKAGDFFGELSILVDHNPVRTANVVAATELEVVAIQKAAFLKLMQQHSELALNLCRVLGQRLAIMNERVVSLTMPEMNRVARTLIQLSKQGKTYNESGIVLLPNIALKDWVLFCNTPQDKFMDIIEHLRNVGAIEWQNQRIAVKDMALLSRFSAATI